MSSRIALIDPSNVVINVIVGDIATYTPPAGITMVEDDAGLAGIGGAYVGGIFSPPVVVPPPPVDLDAIDLAKLDAALADLDAIDLAKLDAALAEAGGVVRGLALVMLDEINALRTRAGLAVRTQTQLRDAIKAKMR